MTVYSKVMFIGDVSVCAMFALRSEYVDEIRCFCVINLSTLCPYGRGLIEVGVY